MTLTVPTGTEPAVAAPASARPHRRRLRALAHPGVVVGATALIVVGLVLRLVTKSDLWLDEALTVNIARLPLRDIPAALRQDGAPPLYYVLLHGWMRIFGTSDLAVRSLSGLCSALTLPVIFRIGERLGGRRAAWAATILLATNPFAIRYATETRMYALVVLEVSVALLLVLRALTSDLRLPEPLHLAPMVVGRLRRRSPVAEAERALDGGGGWRVLAPLPLAAAALLWTHYWGIYLIAATGIVLLWRWRRCPDAVDRAAAFWAGVALSIGVALWLPWLPTFLYQAAHTGTPWAAPAGPSALIDVLDEFAGGGSQGSRTLAVGFAILLFLGLFGAAVEGGRVELDFRARTQARPLFAVAVLCPALAVAAGMLSKTAFAPRYTSVVLPPFLLLAALGVATFGGRRPRIAVLAAAGVLGLSLAGHQAVRNRTQAAALATYLTVAAKPGDIVAYCPDQLGPSTSRLLGPGFDQITYPRGDGPRLINWVDYDDVNKAASPAAFARSIVDRAGAHDVWLVSSTRYTTAAKSCTEVELRLSALRPAGRQVLQARPGRYFEPASLHHFPAPAG